MEREPVEITIEPTHIDILSYAGPDRSISSEAIREAKKLKARRYRNRRLGDFLKELGLTESRATGIPTIQKHLRLNGNKPASIATDDDRSYFLITIPCREDMIRSNYSDRAAQHTSALSLSDISVQLTNELENTDLQAYIIEIQDIDFLKSRLANLISQVYLQVWSKAKDPQSILISDVLKLWLRLSKDSLTSSRILERAGVESLYKLRRYILNPAIENGYIEMSDPAKPTSSRQSYRLTQAGLSLLMPSDLN